MFVIPFKIDDSRYALYVILTQESLDRIKQYDPAVVSLNMLPEPWRSTRPFEVAITYMSSDEEQQIIDLCGQGKVLEALRLVTRGFCFRPDLGDHDGPMLSLLLEPGERKQ